MRYRFSSSVITVAIALSAGQAAFGWWIAAAVVSVFAVTAMVATLVTARRLKHAWGS